MSDLEGEGLHLAEVWLVFEAIVVTSHAQVRRDVLQHELDKEEELVVKHLTIDNELSIIFLNHVTDPVRHFLLNTAVVNIHDLFFFVSWSVAFR